MFAQVKSFNILNRIPPLSFHQVHYLERQNSLIRYQTAVFSYAGYQKPSCLFSFNKTGGGLSKVLISLDFHQKYALRKKDAWHIFCSHVPL